MAQWVESILYRVKESIEYFLEVRSRFQVSVHGLFYWSSLSIGNAMYLSTLQKQSHKCSDFATSSKCASSRIEKEVSQNSVTIGRHYMD